MENNYTYPAIFDYSEEGIVNVFFPDFPETFTSAENEKEAVFEAQEVLGLTIKEYEDSGRELPADSDLPDVDPTQKLVYINIWMPYYRSKIKEVYVKKTLTIPEWLNVLALQNDLNFSAILVDGIKEKLNLKGP